MTKGQALRSFASLRMAIVLLGKDGLRAGFVNREVGLVEVLYRQTARVQNDIGVCWRAGRPCEHRGKVPLAAIWRVR